MSRTPLSLAGFQVILVGRVWVIAEAMGLWVLVSRMPEPEIRHITSPRRI